MATLGESYSQGQIARIIRAGTVFQDRHIFRNYVVKGHNTRTFLGLDFTSLNVEYLPHPSITDNHSRIFVFRHKSDPVVFEDPNQYLRAEQFLMDDRPRGPPNYPIKSMV